MIIPSIVFSLHEFPTIMFLWKVLSLHHIPKVEEGIPIKVTTNQAFDLIAIPIKPERDLSKMVIARRAREIRVLG